MRAMLVVAIFHLLVLCQLAQGQEYDECRMRCDGGYDACINQPQSPDSEVEAIRTRTCEENLQLCNSGCENLKPGGNDIGPQTNPDIIRPDQR